MTTLSAAEHYRVKVRTAAEAVATIPGGADIAIGMAVAEPPALLTALAARVEAGDLADVRPWYFHSLIHAGTTLLRYELLDRVHPRCMFLSPIERALIRRGEADGRVPIEFVPVRSANPPGCCRSESISRLSSPPSRRWTGTAGSPSAPATIIRRPRRAVRSG